MKIEINNDVLGVCIFTGATFTLGYIYGWYMGRDNMINDTEMLIKEFRSQGGGMIGFNGQYTIIPNDNEYHIILAHLQKYKESGHTYHGGHSKYVNWAGRNS